MGTGERELRRLEAGKGDGEKTQEDPVNEHGRGEPPSCRCARVDRNMPCGSMARRHSKLRGQAAL